MPRLGDYRRRLAGGDIARLVVVGQFGSERTRGRAR